MNRINELEKELKKKNKVSEEKIANLQKKLDDEQKKI